MTTKRLAIAIGLGLVGTIGCAGSVPKREVEMGQLHRKIGQLSGLDQVPLDKVEYQERVRVIGNSVMAGSR